MKISRNHFYIAIILAVSFLSYVNIFHNDFIWDDQAFIVEWNLSRSFENIPAFMKGEVPEGHYGVYRPLRSVFYAISYKLWETNPVAYHFQSILVHLACTFLVYLIISNISKSSLIAFITSLLFGIHTVHVESITFITTSFDIIGVFFFLLSFYLYIMVRENNKHSFYWYSILSATIAFFTYELTISLPILLLLYDFCIGKSAIKDLKQNYKRYLPYFFACFLYIFIRMGILHIVGRGSYLAGSFFLTMLTMVKAFMKYIMLMIWPFNSSVNHIIPNNIYSMAYADISTNAVLKQSVFEPFFIFSLVVLISLVAIAVLYWKKNPLVSFSILWFFIALAPVSYLIPQSAIMAEKYAYISSIGFCILFAVLFTYLYSIPKLKITVTVFLVVLFISITSSTLLRNADWKNEMSLWSKTLTQAPGSALANYNLGRAYHTSGDIGKAIGYYNKTLALNSTYENAMFNLAYAYQQQGNYTLAIDQYIAYIKVYSDDYYAYYNMGLIYQSANQFDMAIQSYETSIKLNPKYIKPYLNIALIYYQQNMTDEALSRINTAMKIDPTNKIAKEMFQEIKK